MGEFGVDAKDIVKRLRSRRKKREKPPRTEFSTVPAVQRFYETHGADFVRWQGWVLFKTGAMLEHGSAYMLPPPKDEWECCKLQERYWSIRAEIDEDEFLQFKGYLHGTGRCPEHVITDADKLAYLKELKACAEKSRAKLRQAKRNTKDARPAWMAAKEKDEAREAKRKRDFMDEVDSIKL
jgi:hypothetical protein